TLTIAGQLRLQDPSPRIMTQSQQKMNHHQPPASPPIHPLSLHDALPISTSAPSGPTTTSASTGPPAGSSKAATCGSSPASSHTRSEEHTSELQSPYDLVCRLLLEKKKLWSCTLPCLGSARLRRLFL